MHEEQDMARAKINSSRAPRRARVTVRNLKTGRYSHRYVKRPKHKVYTLLKPTLQGSYSGSQVTGNAGKPALSESKALRYDPTRTITLRLSMLREMRRRYALLRRDLYRVIGEEDAFGLKQSNLLDVGGMRLVSTPLTGNDSLSGNAGEWDESKHDRGEGGRFGSGGGAAVSTKQREGLGGDRGRDTAAAPSSSPKGGRLDRIQARGEAKPGSPSAAPASPVSTSSSQEKAVAGVEKAKGFLGRSLEKVGKLADKVPVIGHAKRAVAATMGAIHGKLEKRYGSKAATVIMTSGSLGGYPVMAASLGLLGFTVPFVTDLVSIALHTVAAEGMYQLGYLKSPAKPAGNSLYDNAEGDDLLDEDTIRQEGKEAWAEIIAAYLQTLAPHVKEIEAQLADVDPREFGVAASPPAGNLATNTVWAHETDPRKVERFRVWLREQIDSTLAGDRLIEEYIRKGYRKGQGRGYNDAKAMDKAAGLEGLSREEYLRQQEYMKPTVQKVKLLAGRAYNDLEGINSRMSTVMGRILADGIMRGRKAPQIVEELANELSMTLSRAEGIVHTELVRAHAEGQLDAMEDAGVEEVEASVEWDTAGDGKVCELCKPLEHVVLKISEARGMLPRHPRCRCAWKPAGSGVKPTKTRDRQVVKLVGQSIRAETGERSNKAARKASQWPGAELTGNRQETGNITLPPLQMTGNHLRDSDLMKALTGVDREVMQVIANASFFEECERDDLGHCKPGDGSDSGKSSSPSKEGAVVTKKSTAATSGGGAAESKPKGVKAEAAAIVKGKIKETDQRAFTGKPTGGKISKQLAGAIGELVIIEHLKDLGFSDAREMNLDKNNYPIDIIQDHETIEAKTGQSSNGAGAQQWRLTIGEPGKEEKAWLAKASPEEKAEWNQAKQKAIHDRKMTELKGLEEELGHKIKSATYTVILNHDTQTADIHRFDGWHDRIGWTSEQAKQGYVRSVKYGD